MDKFMVFSLCKNVKLQAAVLACCLFVVPMVVAAGTPIKVNSDETHSLALVKLILQSGVKSDVYSASDGMLDSLSKQFKEMGYNVQHGEGDSIFEQKDSVNARMILGGKINFLECDKIAEYREMYDCNMAVKWEVFDAIKEEVVYEAVTRFRREFYLTKDSSLSELKAMVIANIQSLQSKLGFVNTLKRDSDKSGNITKYTAAEYQQCKGPKLSLPKDMEKAIKATVVIKTPKGTGSGFYISPDGLVLTAAHVVAGQNQVQLKDNAGNTVEAQVLRRVNSMDIAILKVDTDSSPCLRLNETEPSVGTNIYGIGAPATEELSFSVARGIVSGVRKIGNRRMIQTDASINPGNSGGPLLNEKGLVVAVVVEKISGESIEGLGFGVAIHHALESIKVTGGPQTSASLLSSPDEVGPQKIVDESDPIFSKLSLATSSYPHLKYYSFKQKKLYSAGRVAFLVMANSMIVGGAVMGIIANSKYNSNVSRSPSGEDLYSSEDDFKKIKMLNIAGWSIAGLGLGLDMLFLLTGKSQETLDKEDGSSVVSKVNIGLGVAANGLTLKGSF